MRYGSLFSGIGGFDLGFDASGMVCEWQVEIDDNCANILRKHYPDTERHEDIKDVGKERKEKLSPVGLICGGFPCQDVSIAGRREGLDGERSGLWFEFHRILEEMLPKWVVIENVPGLLSSVGGRDFATVVRGLVDIGYGVAWRVLDSKFFRIAQQRRRVFIVGSLGNGCSSEVLFERTSGTWDIEESGEQGSDTSGQFTEGIENNRLEKPIEANDDDDWLYAIQNTIIGRVNGGPQGKGWSDKGSMFTMDASGQPHAIAWEASSQDGAPRIHYDGISPTLNTMGGGLRQPIVGIRRLTPRECERLQGFPDDWTYIGVRKNGQRVLQVDSTRYKQIGNAVSVPVIKWIGNRIMKVEQNDY